MTDPEKLKKCRRLLNYSRVRAKELKVDCAIDLLWLLNQPTKCARTGIDLVYDVTKCRHRYAPSIDRKDNSKGYTPDNCQLVIWAYNSGKNVHTEEELYNTLKKFCLEYEKLYS